MKDAMQLFLTEHDLDVLIVTCGSSGAVALDSCLLPFRLTIDLKEYLENSRCYKVYHAPVNPLNIVP